MRRKMLTLVAGIALFLLAVASPAADCFECRKCKEIGNGHFQHYFCVPVFGDGTELGYCQCDSTSPNTGCRAFGEMCIRYVIA